MAKTKRKRIVKPKEDKQVMDGLNVSFDEAMAFLAQPLELEDSEWARGLTAIERKHLSFFKTRQSMREGEDYLGIEDYFVFSNNRIAFISSYELPTEVQREIIQLAQHCFPEPQ